MSSYCRSSINLEQFSKFPWSNSEEYVASLRVLSKSKRVKQVSPKVSAANLPDSSNPGCKFYVRNTRSGRSLLVDTSAQLSVIPRTPAARPYPNPGLFLQAVNTSPIITFVTCSLSLDIGFRRLFPWVFVVADIPCAILGADFLAAFDLLVNCLQSRLHDKTINLTVRGISFSDAPRKLAVLEPEPENQFRQLLAKYPGLTRPNFSTSIPPHDIVHHIQTTGPPVFSRSYRLVPARLAAANAKFEHMLQMDIIHVLAAFYKVKADLADATLLAHFSHDAPISLMVDASNVAVGAVLQQYLADRTQPLAFFSRKLSPNETRYSTFGREHLAVFLAVKHFQHFLEDRDFTMFTDHQPISFAFKSTPNKLKPGEIRQLDYISQFTSDTRHVDRSINGVAGALPRPSIAHLQLSPGIDLAEMAADCTRIRSVAYHPTAYGMVKRFHRQLKASLRAADDPENWTDHLPLVRLGIRSSLKSNLGCSAAELVFGATVRLPRQKISLTPRVAVEDPTNLLHRLRQFMRTHSPALPRSPVSESYLEKDSATCSHVYLRCDRVRRPLEPTYDGPFRVISRGTKNFRIQRGTREEVVSVDRLKAAVPNTSPDEPCGLLPLLLLLLLLLLPDPLLLFPVYFICRHVRDPQLQLPPTQLPTL
ncbi:hypothetical protein SprV_0501778100 [Sparganum proliferum]